MRGASVLGRNPLRFWVQHESDREARNPPGQRGPSRCDVHQLARGALQDEMAFLYFGGRGDAMQCARKAGEGGGPAELIGLSIVIVVISDQ